MKRVAGLFLLLVAAIWLVAQIAPQPIPVGARAIVESPWRRTVNGWERSDQWVVQSHTSRRPASVPTDFPHPVTLALFELLGATLFLLASQPASQYSGEK
ncbi:MAG TPA: hypothetical protein VG056_05865 [Pirellulales bacterium]|nr:hypothetical protein [Pirellulales bacterium]